MKAKLIIASSETDADLYYATRILIPDAFVYLEVAGKRTIYVSDLEFSRALAEAQVDAVVNLCDRPKRYGSALAWIISGHQIKEVSVPENFPIKYAEMLKKLRVKIKIQAGEFFENRAMKNPEEIRDIRATQKVNDRAMRSALAAIKQSRIRKDGKLAYQGKILTSEFLKEIIGIEFLRGGCKSEEDIVSCGLGSAQPHNLGSGPLLAHQPIVIDLYPRSVRSRHYADMTRTVVRGKASPEIRKMHATVLAGQKAALRNIRAGAVISSLEQGVREGFEKAGYTTELQGDSPQGFIHSLGHGVGLEIHEPPFINRRNEERLQAGQVITVEPGLYYPQIGGVRIEDLVLVKEQGCENFTKTPKVLEI